MTCKRLMLLCLLSGVMLNLSGCSSLSAMFGQSQNTDQTSDAASDDTPSAEEALANEAAQDNALSEEEVQAQQDRQAMISLVNLPNKYRQNRKQNSQTSRAMLLKALEAYQADNHAVANTLLEQAKAQQGGLNSTGYVLAGDIYLALANNADTAAQDESKSGLAQYTEQAMQSYRDALSLNPHNYKAANRLAATLREQGEFEQALRLYQQAIEAYPGYALSYRNRGILYDLYMGDKQAAFEDYQKYAKLLELQQAYFADKQAQSDVQQNLLVSAEPEVAAQSATLNNDASAMFIAPEHTKDFLSEEQIKRELRRVKGWLRDVGRQAEQASVLKQTNDQYVSDMQTVGIHTIEKYSTQKNSIQKHGSTQQKAYKYA